MDDGPWMEATYEVVEGGLGALERFEWVVALDPENLASGNRSIEVRGLNEQGAPSLPVFTTVMGTGDGDGDGAGLGVDLVALSAVLVLLILLGLLVQGAQIDEPSTLHSLSSESVEDALLLDEQPLPEAEKKGPKKGKKS